MSQVLDKSLTKPNKPIKPICPHCQTPLTYNFAYGTEDCEKCGYTKGSCD